MRRQTLVRAAETQPTPPRFVHASSNAVFGPRNPHRTTPPLTADDPMRPCDIYSGTKAEAEEIVRSSKLDWVLLRFGGVLSTDFSALPFSADAMFFESALPSDGRLHNVDVRDVGWACAAATTADVVGEILLIAGDDSHRMLLRRDRPRPHRRAGPSWRVAARTPRRPRQRHRLVRHRLDGHHPGTGGAEVPALFMARHGGRVEVEVLVDAILGPADRADRSRNDETPVGVLEGAGSIRRSMGCDPHQVGRARTRPAIRPLVNA